jgi:LAO/AO transport system kinase
MAADTSIVVLVPGYGDGIQAIKAGVLEIADIFVINKSEQGGADQLEQELRIMLEMGSRRVSEWMVPIYQTEAITGEGIEELISGVRQHKEMLHRDAYFQQRKRERIRVEFMEILRSALMKQIARKLDSNGTLDQIVENIVKRKVDPYSVVEEIIQDLALK